MNFTKHAKQRWVQRMVGITDRNEMNQYLSHNEPKIIEDMNKMFENAVFIYKGQIGDNITRHYYIRDNVILVGDTQDSAIITVFKCDFGFPEATNRKVIKDLLELISSLNSTLEQEESNISSHIQFQENIIETLDSEMAILQAKLTELKARKESVQADIRSSRTRTESTRKQLEHNAMLLCNSIDYKTDLKEMASR